MRRLAVFRLAAAAFCLYTTAGLLWYRHVWQERSWRPSRTDGGVLQFQLCEGYAEQVLSLFYGLVLARSHGRVAHLPNFLLHGGEGFDWQSSAAEVPEVPGHIWNLLDGHHLAAVLQRHQVGFLDAVLAPGGVPQDVSFRSLASASDAEVARVGCPLFQADRGLVEQHRGLFFDILGLQPSPYVQTLVQQQVERLGSNFNYVHIRDAIARQQECAERNSSSNGCDADVSGLPDYLQRHSPIRPGLPLLLGVEASDDDRGDTESLVRVFESAGYEVHLPVTGASLPRELSAAVQHHTAVQASCFFGHTGSSFSVLAILARQQLDRPSGQYNSDRHPLEAQLPFFQLPWVFAVNGFSPGYYLEMVQRSVLSLANTRSSLKPYCLFLGNSSMPIYRWLQRRGVVIIFHSPAWGDELWEVVQQHKEDNSRASHLYGDKVSLVSTFVRIDIPILDELLHYTYVLYTDNDIYFRRPLSLADFDPLPATVAMTIESPHYPWLNAGVMLMHMPALRESYQGLLETIMSRHGKLMFREYGPGDQGAYNLWYKDSKLELPERFNTKVYNAFDSEAVIVHFHGPKPSHYVEALTTGSCSFFRGPMCLRGALPFCRYMISDGYYALTNPRAQQAVAHLCRKASEATAVLEANETIAVSQ